MIQITKKIDIFLDYPFQADYKLEELLFFDIETTGFTAEVSSLYLIGCSYFQNGSWYITQWFTDDYASELEILHAFFAFIKPYRVLIHYNGSGFDLPYILKKCEMNQLNYNFNSFISLDIYKKILPYKKIFKLDNLKQKTIEQYLDVKREDTFGGGELIQVYGKYLKCRLSHNPEEKQLLHLLTLHNEDDIKGLLQISSILCYSDLFEQEATFIKGEILKDHYYITLQLHHPIKKRVNFGNQDVYVSVYDNLATIKVLLYRDELKFFYSNYKDYYYLSAEDTAIHKSVAFYVDKDYRTKAKAANCYSKKTGCFIPQYQDVITPYFRIDYHDKISYIEISDTFQENPTEQYNYAYHLLHMAIKLTDK